MPYAATRYFTVEPVTARRTPACVAAACLAVAQVAAGCSSPAPAPQAPRPVAAAAPSPSPARPAAIVPSDPRLVPVVLTPPRPLPAARLPLPLMRPRTDAGWRPLSERVAAARILTVAATEEATVQPRQLPVFEAVDTATIDVGIHRLFEGYARDFNHHDAAAAAAHWMTDAENVDLDTGGVTRGRQAVQAVFGDLFAVDDAATIGIELTGIRPLREDVAIVDGLSRIDYADGTAAGSRFSAVVARDKGHWRLASVREAEADVAARQRPLESLAWLAGSWEDLGAGQAASTQASWSADRGFLVRTHIVAPDPASTDRPRAGDAAIPELLPSTAREHRTLTELIGWDPERQEIRSWHFAADGRFAEATWTRDGSGWVLTLEGRGADAGREATCRIEPVSPGRLAVTCDSDTLAALLPPAGEFERTAR